MPSTRSCVLLTTLLLTTAAIAADAPAPLPLDLAFARRDAWKQLQPAISPDSRYLAYDVRTPPQRLDNGPGETAELYLPSGFISIFAGVNLWVSSVETGEARPVCQIGPCLRGSWSPSSRPLAFYSHRKGAPPLLGYDLASRSPHHPGPGVVPVRLSTAPPIC